MNHHHPGARATAARIRAEHDYEATELDATRRRTIAYEAERSRRGSLAGRVRALLAHQASRFGSESAREEAAAPRP